MITSAGVVGPGVRRAPLLAVHRQRRAAHPWRTLTGRQQLFVDHDWMPDLGEGCRSTGRRSTTAALGVGGTPDSGDGRRGHRSLPDPALEVVDPLRVPGQPDDADAVPRRADDWMRPATPRDRRRRQRLGRGLQPQRRRRRCRAVVSTGSAGDAFFYDSQDRHLTSPLSEISARRRHRQLADPDHDQADAPDRRVRAALLGFNYYGPTGTQRDELIIIRKRTGGGVLMKVRAQIGDGDEPRQVHRLPHLLGHLQERLDQPAGLEYVWFNNVETKPGRGYPRDYEDQERWHGGWKLDRKGRLKLRAGGRLQEAGSTSSGTPTCRARRLLRPWTYDYEHLISPRPGDTSRSRGRTRRSAARPRPPVGPELGRRPRGARQSCRRDPNRRDARGAGQLEFEQAFMMYLPRICEHCINPSCVASCPRGRCTSARRTGSCSSTRRRCRSGASASPAAPTRRSTSTGTRARPRSATSATRGSRRAADGLLGDLRRPPPPRRHRPRSTPTGSRRRPRSPTSTT